MKLPYIYIYIYIYKRRSYVWERGATSYHPQMQFNFMQLIGIGQDPSIL